ncbi:hypothetical protein [Paenibacillus sp. Aloe-11]|uniref:hypothetical protein n=1 Tax=Paenibacillus sp. Aloe-11 TaxID=1050222 RepID=UPI00024F0638|nr:hypothetical protein [Paenibacillus sp. Aloe-11]EHS58211.1 hypothetical protein WG8_1471 [Paenibacillus sp. Aloe-11]
MKKKLNVMATAVLLASITASYAYASSSTDDTTEVSTSTSVAATQEDSSTATSTATSTDSSTTDTSATVEAPPEGTPPDGEPPSGKPGEGSDSYTDNGTAKYTQSGKSVTLSKQTIAADQADQSIVKVTDSGKLTLTKSTLSKKGATSSDDYSNFYGLNAGVLAASASTIQLSDSTVKTDADGANAVFATGEGSTIHVKDVTIQTSANSSRGLDATLKGTVNATNVKIKTAGEHSAAIATDRGNGTINVTKATGKTTGKGSPGIYSTGTITVSNSDLKATGSEAAVIEGRNSITVNNTSLSGDVDRGVMLYQSFSGDAEVGTTVFTMNGGTLTAKAGPIFYSTNTEAVVNLKGATLKGNTGVLLNAAADRWGTTGSNGANVTLNADNQTLPGSITADKISSITANLKNKTTLKGAINPENTAKSVDLTLDKTSKWVVTADSYLTTLTDSDAKLSNIVDNGHTIYYDASASANSWLNGETISLSGGGKLTPVSN